MKNFHIRLNSLAKQAPGVINLSYAGILCIRNPSLCRIGLHGLPICSEDSKQLTMFSAALIEPIKVSYYAKYLGKEGR
jgi:hypothetical protein